MPRHLRRDHDALEEKDNLQMTPFTAITPKDVQLQGVRSSTDTWMVEESCFPGSSAVHLNHKH